MCEINIIYSVKTLQLASGIEKEQERDKEIERKDGRGIFSKLRVMTFSRSPRHM